MEEKKKPGRPLSVIYADAKQAITRQVGNCLLYTSPSPRDTR